MERRSWLWRKKSSERSPGETESSGSLSSHSERYSDDQEASRASPNHAQSPEVSSMLLGDEVNDTVRSLTEKLSAALSNIRAKEVLVKQHAKVAEEAVSGWEKAENEVASLKQQLETMAQKNLALEDRAGHLDDALKECTRQLRQTREEQEQKIHEALIKKTREWESMKFDLEGRLLEIQTQLETTKTEAGTSNDQDQQPKFESLEKENSALKLELVTLAKDFEIRTLERELSTRAAETASKQHLESIKKVSKLEAECRRLRAMARKASPSSDHKPTGASVYLESLTDSQSDSGERLLAVETDISKMGSLDPNGSELSCSDSWASALIVELDQFKNEKGILSKTIPMASMDIDLMDDFLEMERLAALPATNKESCGLEFGAVKSQADDGNSSLKAELETMHRRTIELEEKLERMEDEKAALEMALVETQDRLKVSQSELMEAGEKLMELQRELSLANESKQGVETELEGEKARRMVAESQLELADEEARKLRRKAGLLEVEVKEERALSAEFARKCQNLEHELSRKMCEAETRRAARVDNELKVTQKDQEAAAGKLAECQKTIASLGLQLKSLATLEDFLLDSKKMELNLQGTRELNNSCSNGSYSCKKESDSSEISDGSDPSPNGRERESPPSSSTSLEKKRNGFGKFFSRSRSSSSTVEDQ